MPRSVFVLTPYAGEPMDRLERSLDSVVGADCVWGTHGSLPKTINALAAEAISKGATHLCWLSTGDTLHRARFDRELPELTGQCCLVDVHRPDGVMTLPDTSKDWRRLMYMDNQICGTGMVVPVLTWEELGGFDERLTYCSDWEFTLRLQHTYGWWLVEEVLATAHEYEDGMTRSAQMDTVKARARHRDRGKVAGRAFRMRKYGC